MMMSQRKKARPHIPIPRRNNHIPEDIVFDMLSRLPVKSLLRFSCICKSWSSLIHSRSFITTHLNMSSCRVANDHNHGYVMHMPRSCVETTQVCTVSRDRTFDWISEFRAPFIRYTYVVGSRNGLLCLYDQGRSQKFLYGGLIRTMKVEIDDDEYHRCMDSLYF